MNERTSPQENFSPPQNSPSELLRAAGLRVTAPRLAVLNALSEMGAHRSAESVAEAVRARLGATSTQSVYDNLGVLVEAGLARRIEPAGSAALYELRVGDNHHHLVCRRCGRVEDVECAVGSAPCLHLNDAHGFDIDEAEITFWGVCESCRSDEFAEKEFVNKESAENKFAQEPTS